MATHERPSDYPDRPLNNFVCSPEHNEYSRICEAFLKHFPSVRIWRVQYPSTKQHTCWYAGFDCAFNYEEERYVLNYVIRTSEIVIEFRHPEYLDRTIRETLGKNNDWKTANFTKYAESYLVELISKYLSAAKTDFDIDRTKFRKWHPRKTDK
jgi:hypothetical protein